jgi:hypothetical protein
MNTERAIVSALAVLLIMTPLIFFWDNELLMTYNGSNLTNGFVIYDGLQIYHMNMYALLFTNIATALLLMMKNDTLIKRGRPPKARK